MLAISLHTDSLGFGRATGREDETVTDKVVVQDCVCPFESVKDNEPKMVSDREDKVVVERDADEEIDNDRVGVSALEGELVYVWVGIPVVEPSETEEVELRVGPILDGEIEYVAVTLLEC